MSQPEPLGAWLTLFKEKPGKLYEQMGWHLFEITDAKRGGEAGRWAVNCLQGRWTFEPEFNGVNFWIESASDAAMFKLAWG